MRKGDGGRVRKRQMRREAGRGKKTSAVMIRVSTDCKKTKST